jgi:di/tricarboxylate transporter
VSDAAIVSVVMAAALGMFIWNRVPAVIVAICVMLALFFAGAITAQQALAGLGDPTVILIAGLFVVAAGLEASGFTTWAGQQLIARAGGSQRRAFLLLLLLSAAFTAVISVNGTVAALLPVTIVVALRLGIPTSQLLAPLCFAAHSATMLTLIGAPLNVLAAASAEDAGYGGIGFFEFAVAGVPMLVGSVAIMMLTQRRLLPHRNGDAMPSDFSQHARTLVEQYRIDDGLHRLRVRAESALVGRPRAALDLAAYPGLSLVSTLEEESERPLSRPEFAAGDVILLRGDADAAGRLAVERRLAFCTDPKDADVSETLFNRGSGLAEVVIPPRSEFIGRTAFPGMATPSGDLMILAIQRGGEDLGAGPQPLAAGDTLLLQGTWAALDKRLASPQVLVVDSPDVVRRQAVALGHKAAQAIGVLLLLVVLLAWNPWPAALSTVICAVLMVLLGVLSVPQMWRGIDWNTCVLIGGMIPLATAMTQSGLAQSIADAMIGTLGVIGPIGVLIGLFLVTGAITQLMSNTAAALVMLPIAVAAGPEMGVSPMPLIIAVAIAAHGALLTPVATPVNLMVMGPGGYRFADYWKFGLPLFVWWLVVAVVVVPLYWRFGEAAGAAAP